MKCNLATLLILICTIAYSQAKEAILYADRSIENKLELLRPESIVRNLGSQEGKLIDDEGPSRVIFLNRDQTEYIIMYHLSGTNANSFNLFEVGKIKGQLDNSQKSNLTAFVTDGGIKLSMKIDALITLKGTEYNKVVEEDYIILQYKVDDGNSSILQEYDMPIYIANYYFKDGKLQKFKFGFPNL